ncbi:MAG: hypothetical protein WBL25_08545 [Anaerolineales bacterium]
MKRIFLIIWLVLLYFPQSVLAQEADQLTITSPLESQFVQGVVTISGSVTILGFSSYELAFAYENDPTQTWFELTSSSLPVFEGELGSWDTTTLTDGDYALRVRVFLLDGTVQETTVSGLRVRNYTPIPTSTPTPTSTPVVQFAAPTAQLIAPAPATAASSLPTPTHFPPNPASLAEASISGALGKGAALALVLFVVFGLLLRLRRE